MIGSTRTARVRPPETRVRPPVIPAATLTKMARPRSPYTIDGTPARLRMLASKSLVSLVSGAYSSR